jgi:hypothetical protein
MRHKGITREAVEICARKGLTIRETAAHLGINKMTLWRRARRLGLTFRQGVQGRIGRGRSAAIIAAIQDGANTSVDMAARFNIPRPQMSGELWQLAGKGIIEKAGYEARAKYGRIPIKWRVARSLAQAA